MSGKEIKLKMVRCRICGKEYSKYTRPLGMRSTCSEECNYTRLSNIKAKGERVEKATNQIRLCFFFIVIIVILVVVVTLMVAPQVIFRNNY